MAERFIKSGWHTLLVIAALIELRTARTPLRKLLIGAAAGWHAVAAYDDLMGSDDRRLGDGREESPNCIEHSAS